MTGDRTALVGHVGRAGVKFALTDRSGSLRQETARSYEAAKHATISAALMAFKDESSLTALPRRCVLAVAGLPRGDTISVTSSRWFISKAGLTAILQRPPLVLNDFAAKVWAVSASGPDSVEAADGVAPPMGPGTFAVIGMGRGLGVAAFMRDENDNITIIPTEAGHSELVDSSPEIAPIVERIRKQNRFCSAESLLAGEGLVSIYRAISETTNGNHIATADEVIKAASDGDEDASRACLLYAKALWRFAGNLTLIYGAWDGLFLTGRIVKALRPTLSNPEARQSYVIPGPYANLLRRIPAGYLLLDDSTMRGAAEAMRRLDTPA